MNYLIGIPVLYGAEHCRAAIHSAASGPADVLVIDNGSDPDVKEMLSYCSEITVKHRIVNPKNIFVNPAWNQLMEFFLRHEQYDVLCIMNSDVVLPGNFVNTLNRFYAQYPNDIPLPVEGHPKPLNADGSLTVEAVSGGVAGTFICLTRQQVKNVYPIPDCIKIWFGDNHLYEVHRQLDIKTYLVHDLKIQHGNSRTVSILPGISELIEQDKVAWANEAEPKMIELIKTLKATSASNRNVTPSL